MERLTAFAELIVTRMAREDLALICKNGETDPEYHIVKRKVLAREGRHFDPDTADYVNDEALTLTPDIGREIIRSHRVRPLTQFCWYHVLGWRELFGTAGEEWDIFLLTQ